MKIYHCTDRHRYNHGCRNSATWQDNGDGTAICIAATSCHSCWQVGHDADYTYATVGEVRPLEYVLGDLEEMVEAEKK